MLRHAIWYLREPLFALLLRSDDVMKKNLEEVMGGLPPSLQESIVIIGDRVNFTLAGRRYYRPRFARVGIDIRQVKTIEQFREAANLSFSMLLEEAAAWMNRYRPKTDAYRLLQAIIRGDPEDQEALELRLARKAKVKLAATRRPAANDESGEPR